MVALAEAHRLHVVLENYPVRLVAEDEHSAPIRWKRQLEKDHELARRLQGKRHWAVQIEPNWIGIALIGGPVIVVFVDTTSGAVLGHIRMAGDLE